MRPCFEEGHPEFSSHDVGEAKYGYKAGNMLQLSMQVGKYVVERVFKDEGMVRLRMGTQVPCHWL